MLELHTCLQKFTNFDHYSHRAYNFVHYFCTFCSLCGQFSSLSCSIDFGCLVLRFTTTNSNSEFVLEVAL